MKWGFYTVLGFVGLGILMEGFSGPAIVVGSILGIVPGLIVGSIAAIVRANSRPPAT